MDKQIKNWTVWLINIVLTVFIIYISWILFPSFIVLGNNLVTPIISAIISALILTFVLSLIKPAISLFGLKKMKDLWWTVLYGLVNIAVFWIVARLAVFTGLGISSYLAAISLGLILTFVQYLLWKWHHEKKRK